MSAKSVLIVCGVAMASLVLVGCGASGASSSTNGRRQRDGVVYEWGRAGGGLISPGHSFGRSGAGQHRFHAVIHLGAHPGTHNAILGVRPTRVVPTPVSDIKGTVSQVATSNSTGYALTRSGAVYAWGTGSEGELGNGTTTEIAKHAVRVHFPSGVRIAKLPNPMPYNGAMAIDTRGDVWAWGNDEAREFCQPTGMDIDIPVRVPLSHVTLAAGAWRHAIYDAGAKVLSCGLSDHGQLGNVTVGLRSDTGDPVAVQGLPSGPVKALTSAFGNAGALMADGAYYDWGINSAGQLGDGTFTQRSTAVRVVLPGRVSQVFQGGSFPNNGQTMAILANRQLWVWGANASGQLGDGATTDRARPMQLEKSSRGRFVAVSSGGASDYAIGRSRELWAWGQNSESELGDGSSDQMSKRPVNDSLQVTQVSATARNAAALAGPAS
jgi:alpha-tubulin suppressor-like RCC1 family protein